MGFKSVFRVLQEVFPQVDVRILKAAAIEHSKDADAAVEFILFEVLPSVSIPVGASDSFDKQDEQPFISNTLETSYTSGDNHYFGSTSFGREEQSPLLGNQVAIKECSLKPTSVVIEDYENGESTRNISLTHVKEPLADSPIFDCYGGNGPEQMLMPLEKHQEVNIIVRSHQESHPASSSKGHVDHVVDASCSAAPYDLIQDLIRPVDNEPVSFVCGKSSRDGNAVEMEHISSTSLSDPAPAVEELQDLAEDDHKIANSSISEHERRELICLLDNVTEQVILDSKSADSEENSSSVTRSGQICRIDLLEDSINNAKNNKKTLFSSMESVITLMREVELHEKIAEQAKQEAATGGLEILAKAEDLRQTLQRAKEANDMHAGEVYGEKAILATEARELQSRLLNLSDDRNKSLAILDEMHQTLEARLVAAEEMRKAAEQEKLEKEEFAQKYLAEQEDMMDKVIQESKRLQLEAEENAKLREFLMDRGHVVDILQGEIAVVCKDIKLLKEKCDDRILISKLICSSQTSCKLASSNSSYNLLPDQLDEPPTTPKRTSPDPPTDSQLQKSSPQEKGTREGGKMLLEDGWDLFEDEVVLLDA